MQPIEYTREVQSHVNPVFPERWSPRSFDPTYQIPREELQTLFEAARWAPSSFNEQPWFFHIALRDTPAFSQFMEPLTDSNKEWVKNTSLLCYVVGRRFFKLNNSDNTTFEFDCGAAWMSLALQARAIQLYAHGMVGFDRAKAGKILQVDESQAKVIAAIAIGKRDDPKLLSVKLRDNEKMNQRRELDAIFKVHEATH
ncbi:MAG: nitroreductase family protein [Bdellovibrionaceae bacterium]|nr:nitroreductase family protein [Pseudobdellovibrionaceae bacterium]